MKYHVIQVNSDLTVESLDHESSWDAALTTLISIVRKKTTMTTEMEAQIRKTGLCCKKDDWSVCIMFDEKEFDVHG